ncbi:MAG TPA: enolase C-terminal domain-like protein [Solirubrobacterales bacterium]|nr:enolase C-terminal domain-like protein [Solirubrobacterales bacterium]
MAVAAPEAEALETPIGRLEVSAFTVPTEEPESDGTLSWDSTTIVIVEASAGDVTGLGYAYGDVSVATFVDSKLAEVVEGRDALSPPAAWAAMQVAIRNAGRPGVGAMAVSAVDVALWDLRAKLLGVCLADALPRFHEAVPVYGSGGFTSYSPQRLRDQLEGWMEAELPRVKVKVGREPGRDPDRLALCRKVIGDGVELMVDANGAFAPKRALLEAERYAEHGVSYLEEPVSSEDRAGLAFVRDRAPAGMAIAAGEYEWDLPQLGELAGCVDIVQADATRVGGITNMLRADGICKAAQRRFSAHCAPAISAHACCAIETLEHLEYFHDHVRIERMLFDGTLDPEGGRLVPDRSRPGLGLELKRADAEEFAA